MPLIDCPDCGRRVSDLAEACPGCARPIARTLAEERVAGSKPVPATGRRGARPLQLAPRAGPEKKEAEGPVAGIDPTKLTTTTCAVCGNSVQLAFRPRRAYYVCEDCDERAFVALMKRRLVIRTVMVTVLVISLLAAAVYGIASSGACTPAPRDPVQS
jgi:hypothetical protein